MSAKISPTTGPSYSDLPQRVRLAVWAFLSLSEFLALQHTIKPFGRDARKVVEQHLRRIRVEPWNDEAQMRELAGLCSSSSHRRLLEALRWVIEHNMVAGLVPLLHCLFTRIVFTETVKRKPNPILPLNVWPVAPQGAYHRLVRETPATEPMRHKVFSGVINFPLHSDGTLFHMVCRRGQDSFFDILKRFEPDVNACGKDGNGCLAAAIISGNETISEELVSMGANCSAVNSSGESPLMLACAKRLASVALLIISVRLRYDTTHVEDGADEAYREPEGPVHRLRTGTHRCGYGSVGPWCRYILF